ncbi:hypothetical protein RS030_91519 [Cryptosporidium xiaoi]|uniref:LEM3/CDC50 family protein n=1 Tax=Cryptosporidium xiaoi TaxID=659607 RepID=A0AAV9XTL8_9CRYT
MNISKNDNLNNIDSSIKVISVNNVSSSMNAGKESALVNSKTTSHKVVTDNNGLNEIENINNINNSNITGYSSPHEAKLVKRKNNRDIFTDDSDIFLMKFKNKKLESWNPIYTPNYLLFIYFVAGVVFIAVGVYLFMSSNSIIECEIKYEDSPGGGVTIDTVVEITSENCKPSHIEGKKLMYISGDVYIYYKLYNFYQNNRNYILNRSEKQLNGGIITDKNEISSCYPLITDENDNILLPCGIAANAVFNDTFTVFDGDGDLVDIDDSTETITVYSDRVKYKNPPEEYIRDNNISNWLPEDIFPGKIENPHFIVWMRNSAVSDFNKLYGKLTSNKNKIVLPIKIHIKNRYQCSIFNGSKHIVISQVKWFGGKNPYFGVLYIASGIAMLLFFVFFLVKNKTSISVPGDLRYLYLNVLDNEREYKRGK